MHYIEDPGKTRYCKFFLKYLRACLYGDRITLLGESPCQKGQNTALLYMHRTKLSFSAHVFVTDVCRKCKFPSRVIRVSVNENETVFHISVNLCASTTFPFFRFK